MAKLRAAILCGGAGTRLWPLSREHAPKQFHPLVGDRSLLTETVARALSLPDAGTPIILTGENLALAARDHAEAGGARDARILLEPGPRNTAPAAAMAAHAALAEDPEAIVALLASDHHISDLAAFRTAIGDAARLAEEGYIVTLGIVPTDANTGYGYIQRGEAVGTGYRVERFTEKPDAKSAERYAGSGVHYWNAGMFIFQAATYLEELRRHRPDIAAATEAAWISGQELPHGRLAGPEAWASCPSESIDYAVAEKTERAAVVPAAMGWSDVGSWSSLMNLAQRDDRGNALFGPVWTIDSNGCYVRSTSRNVAVIGAQDIIVIETPDAVLIVHKDATQQVKHAAAQFASLSGLPDAAE